LPDSDPEWAPGRFAAWLSDLRRVAEREPRRVTLAEATRRLRERFPRFSAEVAQHMAESGTREDQGVRLWKFDPLHQTRSPQPYYVAQARAFWRRVACPVLYVEGRETPLRLSAADLDERLRLLHARRLTIDGAGHHPHLEKPEAFARAVIPFLDEARHE
jgi:pimeloyl-ACP methyl ester carboxylesterase